MVRKRIEPPEVMPSIYGPQPRRFRAADLPDMVSVRITDLFPDMTGGYLQGEGVSFVGQDAKRALAGVDMGMIRPGDTVNVLCSEHGFYLLEGRHYREVVKCVVDAIRERTGCGNVRLRVASGIGRKEADEVVRHFELDSYCDVETTAMSTWDEGVPIQTEIGTLIGLKPAYDADWIVHVGHDEPRDLYFHRMMDRNLKAFVMSYARYETRAVYHGNFFGRSANFLQRAIFDSPFVQDKFAFACILTSTPDGITGVDADNDLNEMDRRITRDLLSDYGKMLRLLAGIDECIAVWDAGRWGYYIHAGGICFGTLENAEYDAFDLSNPASLAYHDLIAKMVKGEVEGIDRIMTVNPTIKAVVVNQAWPGLPISDVPLSVPTFVVGEDQAAMLSADSTNPFFMGAAQTAETLEAAMAAAGETAKTDKILAFDGSFGYITVSSTLADFLRRKAPEVNRIVEEELLPKWLQQRGL
ncbi:MAG: hypothetical protein GY866_32105 [Proteobacteria bacterium]|nr:hypothetical protein [Pseudomonadota bacterium]